MQPYYSGPDAYNRLKSKLAKAAKKPDATSLPTNAAAASTGEETDTSTSRSFDGQIETGFQMAAAHGPLCAEPMAGLAFFVEKVEVDAAGLERESGTLFLSLICGISLTNLNPNRTKSYQPDCRRCYIGRS